MDLIRSIVKDIISEQIVLNEEFIGNDFCVYHVARQETLQGIFKFGFEAYYTASKVGNAYGRGVYSTTSLESSVKNAQRGEYGRVILRCKVKSLKDFLIWDNNIAKRIYGGHWRVSSQLELILPRDVFGKLKNSNMVPGSHFWSNSNDVIFNQISEYNSYTSQNAHAADWYGNKNDEFGQLIKGFIFKGPHDGDVAVIRDFKNVYPIEYSLDFGKSWKPIEKDVNFNKYVLDDIDLKLEVGRLYDEVPFHFENDFARVKKNSKYNYLYKGTYKNGVISPIWFDGGASTFSSKGDCLVIYNNVKYIVHFKKDSNEFLVLDTNKSYLCYLEDLESYLNKVDDEEDVW